MTYADFAALAEHAPTQTWHWVVLTVATLGMIGVVITGMVRDHTKTLIGAMVLAVSCGAGLVTLMVVDHSHRTHVAQAAAELVADQHDLVAHRPVEVDMGVKRATFEATQGGSLVSAEVVWGLGQRTAALGGDVGLDSPVVVLVDGTQITD